MGKFTIDGQFSIAMLVITRGYVKNLRLDHDALPRAPPHFGPNIQMCGHHRDRFLAARRSPKF